MQIVATVGDGASAVREALALQPDVLFFDIRMPGMSGLDAAVLKPVQAARLQKTVSKVQLALASRSSVATYFEATLAQLRALASVALSTGANTASPTGANTASHFGVNSTGSPGPAPVPLRVIQASVGSSIRMVPVDDVLCFEAADIYVLVLTADHEYLIRTPLKDLLPQLDAQRFWQVHRGTVVQGDVRLAVELIR